MALAILFKKAAPSLGLSALMLSLLACSSNDPNSTPPLVPTAPLILTVAPADAGTGVLVSAQPSAVFDQGMAPLTGAQFTLVQGSNAVAGTVTTSGDGLTATFAPTALLAPGTLFTARIAAGALSRASAPLAASRTWTFTTAPALPAAPAVTSTNPAGGALAVGFLAPVQALFSRAMDPNSLTTTTFTVTQNGAAVAGTVAASGTLATFTAAGPLSPSTQYRATLGTGVKDAQGTPLAAAYTWSFTTAAVADTTAPTVTTTSPLANATGVDVKAALTATFSKPINPATVTGGTFTLVQGASPVAGALTFGPGGTTATLTPGSTLAASSLYTVTLGTGVKDQSGNALAAPFTWSFTTGLVPAKGPAAVNLGTAGNYAILAKTGISTVPPSAITGDLGLSPAAASFLTGFSLTADASNVFATSPQIVGKAFAANYAVPSPINLTTAVADMQTAYSDAAGRPTPDFLNLGSGNVGGLTLAPGLYHWASSVTVPSDVTLNGGANDVWIFQASGDLTMGGATRITLSGGAQAKNVFWQIAGQATVGAGAHFEGILLCQTQATLQTGASMNGRILAQTLVALQQATVTVPAP